MNPITWANEDSFSTSHVTSSYTDVPLRLEFFKQMEYLFQFEARGDTVRDPIAVAQMCVCVFALCQQTCVRFVHKYEKQRMPIHSITMATCFL